MITVSRQDAFDAISSERTYQDEQEGDIQSNGDPGDGTRTQHEYILYVQEWATRLATDAFIDPTCVQAGFRKVAALCVAAMEEHGSPHR